MNSKTKFTVLATTILIAIAAWAAERSQPSGVIVLSHEKVAAAFAQGMPLLATNNFKIQAGRRTGPGEVEIHDFDTDIFYIIEGSATLVTGGRPIEPKSVGVGETRAKEITGGVDHSLTKGDIIVIPNGLPHWFKEVTGPFLYYVVKVNR